MPDNERYMHARRITLIGVVVNLSLAILKIVFGFIGHSHGLLADGIHSFSDLLTDGLVLFASRLGSVDADRNHPYGHGRIETAATVALSLLLMAVGFGIVIDAGTKLFDSIPELDISTYVLGIAFISIVANEMLFRYTLSVAEKIRSNLLRANAWHSRADAASSVVVLIGVAGTLMGFPFLDCFAAMIVGVLVVRMGWNLGWSSIKELVDTGLDDEMLVRLEERIFTVPGVESIHQLRTRSVGGNVFIDVHVMVDPTLSVSEGHFIGDSVRDSLLASDETIADVVVHIDPEDDESHEISKNLPMRLDLYHLLEKRFADLPGSDVMHDFILHYLSGKIHIELRLPMNLLSDINSARALQDSFRHAVEDVEHIGSVQVFFS